MMVLLTLASGALAATLTVDAAGAGDFSTLSAAVAASSSGDVLLIKPGVYAECVDLGGRHLTLRGEDMEAVVLDSGACGYALLAYQGEELVLSTLTLRGNRGLYLNGASLVMEQVLASGMGNSAANGGVVEAYGSQVHILGSRFTNNTADFGGVVFAAWYSALTVESSVFEGNTARLGGAIGTYAYDSVSVSGLTMQDNHAATGGAMRLEWASQLVIEDSTFSDNSATGSGGAVALYAVDGVVALDGVSFRDNQAGDLGGALDLEWYSELSVEDSLFSGNSAASWGGALFAYALDSVQLTRGQLCANSAAYGGALGLQWIAQDTIQNSFFVENSAVQGGGLYRYASGSGVMKNNTFAGNSSSDWGSAYFAGWYAYGRFVNNLVVDSGTGTGVYASDPYDYSNTQLSYGGWFQNESQHAGGYFAVDDGVDGHVLADPMFVAWSKNGDCTDDDLRLGSGSPMRDAGDPSLLDRDGTRSDIGAWGGEQVPVLDLDADGMGTDQDCDDSNQEIHPGALEACDGLDNNCDGAVDEAGAQGEQTWYSDWDADGYGDDSSALLACEGALGAVNLGGDCDDQNPYQSPGLSEVCGDGFDQDCDGEDGSCAAPSEHDPDEAGRCGCGDGRQATVLLGLWMLGRRRARRQN